MTESKEVLASIHRAHVYRGLAALFHSPSTDVYTRIADRELPSLRDSLRELEVSVALLSDLRELRLLFGATTQEELALDYTRTFDPAGGMRCPPTETYYTHENVEDGLTRNVEAADIAGFYKAFGVKVRAGSERPDHITAELEFMHLLSLKEAIALTEKNDEHISICRDAESAFLRDHLGRWAEKFAHRLEEEGRPFYSVAGRLLVMFVTSHLREVGIKACPVSEMQTPHAQAPAEA